MNARDLLQAGINESFGINDTALTPGGWSALLAAPSIIDLLLRADATRAAESEVAGLRRLLADAARLVPKPSKVAGPPWMRRHRQSLIDWHARAALAPIPSPEAARPPRRTTVADTPMTASDVMLAVARAGWEAWLRDHEDQPDPATFIRMVITVDRLVMAEVDAARKLPPPLSSDAATLRRYADHLNTCDVWSFANGVCDCGYAALAAPEPAAKEATK